MTPTSQNGLSADEAARRLAADGPNALPAGRRRLFAILAEAIREPMFLLLLAAAVLYLTLGDFSEGMLLFFMVSFTIGLTLYQEGKTERALDALRDLSSPRALVRRDGQMIRIPGGEVVRGDLLVLSEGDRVAADAVLQDADNLQVDESLLTGEAWPVRKQAGNDARTGAACASARPGGDDLPFVWSGTLVVHGSGLACVSATGPHTEVGKIGGALQSLTAERSPLQRETARLVKAMAVGGLAVSLLLTGIYGALHGDWLQAILVGIALSMSLLPEEYSVILAVFPAIGAWRLSRVQVLTRRLSAIETLGSISVLCTDKTGTLTENRMTVVQMHTENADLHVEHGSDALAPEFLALAEFAALASRPQPFDPMEKAFHQLASEAGRNAGQSGPLRLQREYPLSSGLRAMSQAWTADAEGHYLIAAKGAPEAIADLCHLDGTARLAMQAAVDAMANQGLRVLAVASAEFSGDALPPTQAAFAFRHLGLLGLADPLRAEIPDAVRQCIEAGIRVVMITGDYPGTAASIARQAGMPEGDVLGGDVLDSLDDAQLSLRLRAVNVCARITPEQKLRLVQALKANGAIVAMTGDGVNDAPALKAAHVGIAMGGRGTDVAREAAALVLLDDNFASIVRGIRLGRRIFSNMQNAMAYVLSIHVPIAGMALIPVLFGSPILLYPMHIAFLELIIDPACSLAFENEAADVDAMQRPPREVNKPLIDSNMFMQALLEGGGALLLVALSYFWAMRVLPEEQGRAAAFTVMVVANLALIFSNLSHRRSVLHALRSSNRIPLLMAAAAISILLLTLYLPAALAAFRFGPLAPGILAIAFALGLASIVWFELIKFATHGRWRKSLS
jgi:P-type Ca2+ transporter type 2C